MLAKRHPNLLGLAPPDPSATAIMRATLKYVSVTDYTKGLGHSQGFTFEPGESDRP